MDWIETAKAPRRRRPNTHANVRVGRSSAGSPGVDLIGRRTYLVCPRREDHISYIVTTPSMTATQGQINPQTIRSGHFSSGHFRTNAAPAPTHVHRGPQHLRSAAGNRNPFRSAAGKRFASPLAVSKQASHPTSFSVGCELLWIPRSLSARSRRADFSPSHSTFRAISRYLGGLKSTLQNTSSPTTLLPNKTPTPSQLQRKKRPPTAR